jgi:putative transposase
MHTASISASRSSYPLIWGLRRRKPVLVGLVGPVGPVATRCRELIAGTCVELGWEVLALAIQPERIHRFVRAWPSARAPARRMAWADVVQGCAGSTSSHLRQAFPHPLKWPSTRTRSPVASTAGHVSQQTMQRSINAHPGS